MVTDPVAARPDAVAPTVLGMTRRDEIGTAVAVTISGGSVKGRRDLLACWAGTATTAQARRCVVAHYLADLEDDLDAEVVWVEKALDAHGHVSDADLAPVGIPAAAGLAPSLHLNLGDVRKG